MAIVSERERPAIVAIPDDLFNEGDAENRVMPFEGPALSSSTSSEQARRRVAFVWWRRRMRLVRSLLG